MGVVSAPEAVREMRVVEVFVVERELEGDEVPGAGLEREFA